MKGRSDTKESLRELIDFLARGAAPTPAGPTPGDSEENVHQARVHAKRMAAALHLFKPEIERAEFRRERKHIRRAANILAGRRDEDSIRRMLLCCAADFDARERRPLETWLQKNLAGSDPQNAAGDLRRAHKRMEVALRDWPEPEGASAEKLFKGGTLRSFKKAQEAFRKANKTGKAEDFHRWRVWTKRLLLQLELAGELELGCDKKVVEKLEKLQKDLGDLHDLHVAEAWLEIAKGGPSAPRKKLRRRMRGACARLRKKVIAKGEKLFRRKWRKRLQFG